MHVVCHPTCSQCPRERCVCRSTKARCPQNLGKISFKTPRSARNTSNDDAQGSDSRGDRGERPGPGLQLQVRDFDGPQWESSSYPAHEHVAARLTHTCCMRAGHWPRVATRASVRLTGSASRVRLGRVATRRSRRRLPARASLVAKAARSSRTGSPRRRKRLWRQCRAENWNPRTLPCYIAPRHL
jgi:hypothetical protein